MKIKVLNRGEAQKAMEDWVNAYPELPAIPNDYITLRDSIHNLNKRVRLEAEQLKDNKRSDYYIDSQLGLLLYEYLWNQSWFSLRLAANDGFWRYLSICVVPDVVAQRWGKDNADHYYRRPTRIWLRSIWWFVHLSWQESLEKTQSLLACRHFTTDTILNFEERNGRKGTCVEAYRKIIYYYSRVPEEIIRQSGRGKNGTSDDLFRVVMKLNTAKMMVMEPALYLGGEDGYAIGLFKDAGVSFHGA